jgi:DNA-binding Lrp family transcriptional regulator
MVVYPVNQLRGAQRDHLQSLGIGPRDMEVLRFIGEEALLGFTFEGLKRRLGAHPETLSRILDRLEEQRILEKTGQGYQVTERGREVTSLRQLSASEPRLTLLRTLLPHVENPREAIANLRGRWFGPLRWLGYSEDEKGTIMKWITEDGSIQVDAIFSGGDLTIEGRIKEGKDLTDAIKASHQLVGYISKVYPSAPNQRVAYYTVGGPFPIPN